MYATSRTRRNAISVLMLRVAFCFFVTTTYSLAAVVQPPSPPCNVPVTSNNGTSFGCRNPPGGGGSRFHKGTDYGRPCSQGSPLVASMAGSMYCASRADGDGAGNRCRITNGCIVIKYFHMDDPGFVPGTRDVKVGQSIGLSGASGKNQRNKWAAHLHLEIWVDNIPVGAQYFFSKYAGQDVCNDVAKKKDLWADANADMKACPGEPGSGPNPVTPPSGDTEIENEGEDDCSNAEDVVPDPTAPSPTPPSPTPP